MPTITSRRAALAVLLTVSLLTTACIGTSAPSHFYVLEPTAPQASSTSDVVVAVAPVLFPGLLDRQQIVTVGAGHERHLDEFARWAEPFGMNVSSTFAQDLGRHLGSDAVSVLPLRMASPEDVRVVVEILRFDATLGGACELEALWVLQDADGTVTSSGRATSQADTGGDDYEALVAAMSRCIAELAGQVAEAIGTPATSGED